MLDNDTAPEHATMGGLAGSTNDLADDQPRSRLDRIL